MLQGSSDGMQHGCAGGCICPFGTGDKDEIARQVDYLEAKHLVLVQKVGNERLGISKQIVKLTAEGIDYMEGNADQLTGIGE